MDSCEKHVIIACGLCLLSEERELARRKYWIHNVIGANEEKEEFQAMFGRLKCNRQKCFKYFRMGISKFEIFKELLSTDNKTNNTH
jgi:putative NADPH-quinone reductase